MLGAVPAGLHAEVTRLRARHTRGCSLARKLDAPDAHKTVRPREMRPEASRLLATRPGPIIAHFLAALPTEEPRAQVLFASVGDHSNDSVARTQILE